MNPISNLIGKKFNELTTSELMQLIQSYCDQNKYDFDCNFNPKNKEEALKYFRDHFYPIYELKEFFKYWTN